MRTLCRPLRLSPACNLRCDPTGVTLETREEEIVLATGHPSGLFKLLTALRLGGVPEHIAAQLGFGVDALDGMFELLRDQHLILDLDATKEANTPRDAEVALIREAQFAARAIFEQAFWLELLSGQLSASQVLGWGVEFYHFVDAANTYMPLGLAHTRHVRELRPHIARHYVEEMNHGVIFLDGLARSGIDRASILAAPPLPHTRALINLLSELSYEGEVTYTASFAVMQPNLAVTSKSAISDFYGALTQLYPYAAPLFDAFHKHAALDVALDHEKTVFHRLCATGLNEEQRSRAGRTMETVAEAFILFFDGIRGGYGTHPQFAPRRRLFALDMP